MEKNEQDVEVEEIEDVPEIADGQEDTTDYKALAAKNAGIARRYKTKFEKSKIATKVEKGVEKELGKIEKQTKDGFDYGEMAYLESKKVAEDDYDYLLKEVQQTGKELRDVLKFKYVLEELKARSDGRMTKNALPTSKRSGGSAQSEVDYWISQGKMPDKAENPKLFREVRKEKERIELERLKSPPRR
jgi:hypothetical protein